jgi:uncharacterized cupin superfamily protein
MKIVRSADLPFAPALEKGKFANTRKGLSPPPQEAKLQAGMWELPPGKRSFPMHKHYVTEEAMYVLSGKAKIRTPDGETAIGPGDYVSFPPQGPAHQLVNDGAEKLVYLAFSVNTVGADIVEYPDSGKIACSIQQGADRKRYLFLEKNQVDYFHGEE